MSVLIFCHSLRLHFCPVRIHLLEQVHRGLRTYKYWGVFNSIIFDAMRRHGEASAKKPCEFWRAPVHDMGQRRNLELARTWHVCFAFFEMQLQAVWIHFNRSDENACGCIILRVVCGCLQRSVDVCGDCVESKEKALWYDEDGRPKRFLFGRLRLPNGSIFPFRFFLFGDWGCQTDPFFHFVVFRFSFSGGWEFQTDSFSCFSALSFPFFHFRFSRFCAFPFRFSRFVLSFFFPPPFFRLFFSINKFGRT